jgi:hypothetical protein
MLPHGLVVPREWSVVGKTAGMAEQVIQRHRRGKFYVGEPIANRQIKV